MAIDDPVSRVQNSRSQSASLPSRQAQNAFVDFRTVNPHRFVQECYDGNGGFKGDGFKSYLIPNASENFYITRNRMSIYINLFKQFINAKFEQIYKQAQPNHVQTESGSDMPDHLYHEFLSNVTGNGINKSDFSKIAIRSGFVHDVAYIVMDKRAQDLHPYIYIKTANDVVYYKTDEMGNLIEIAFIEKEEKTEDGKTIYRRRYIGVDRWAIQASLDEKTWTDETFTENVLGILPVYTMFTVRPDDTSNYLPAPSNYEIASYCAWLYDKGSKLDYVIDKQAHSLLVLQGNINSIPNGVDNALIIDESERQVFQPTYLTPDSTMPTVHQQRIDSVMNTMMQLMADSGVNVESIQQPESGIARSYKFIATNATLKQTVTMLDKFDKWLYQTYKLFVGDSSRWMSWTEYPTEFAPTISLTVTDLVELINFYGQEQLPLNQIDVHVRLRQLIDPMATKDDSQSLFDEIKDRYKQVEHVIEEDEEDE